MTNANRIDEYRDMLETWVKWAQGPYAEGKDRMILPPINQTAGVLGCTICAGQTGGTGRDRCDVCARRIV